MIVKKVNTVKPLNNGHFGSNINSSGLFEVPIA